MDLKKVRVLGCALLCTAAVFEVTAKEVVSPPKSVHINTWLTEEEEAALAANPPKQSPALSRELASLATGTINQRTAKLVRRVKRELAYMKGGSYMMGDFGPLWYGGYVTPDLKNKPVHKVTLTSFSIARYKTTFAEFDVFTDATGRPRSGYVFRGMSYRHPTLPAGVFWQDAKDYCQWLGKQTGLPFDLPTEAQWEYAARSRGQYFMFATDNGHIDVGRNIPSSWQINHDLSIVVQEQTEYVTDFRTWMYPIGLFPPSPMGLYDMTNDGHEWMNDWYDVEYYAKSPEQDPQGPEHGTERTVRGLTNGTSLIPGITVIRLGRHPRLVHPDDPKRHIHPVDRMTVRCVVNQVSPVKAKRWW